jgi:two-component system sensor kinase FixL
MADARRLNSETEGTGHYANVESAERAAETNEARWRALINAAVDGVIVINVRGEIEVFNPAAEKMFGFSEADVLGKNVNILMPAPYHQEHDRYIEHYVRTGEQKIIGIGREVRARRRSGETFPVHLSVGEMQIGSDRHFIGILHDLTARVALEERLREQAALVRLGEMAAVIAHEVKNPLTAVRGAVQVIGGRLPPDSKEAPIAKEIVLRLDALNGLLQDLLQFARPPRPRLATVNVLLLVRLVADLLKRDPAFDGLEIEVTGSALHASADAELLKIVFQNLLINAAHAMEGRGTIRAAVEKRDGMCSIEIIDKGTGIPAEIRSRLFQPFQTTKARGTGLGLATAKRLVEAHSGTIEITCPPTGGTIVTVQLPTVAT